MKRVYLATLITLIGILAVACSPQPAQTVSPILATRTKTKAPIATPAPVKPFPVTIQLGDKIVSSGDVTFAPQLLVFGGDYTTLVYSISANAVSVTPDTLAPVLTDEKGQPIKLKQTFTLANLDSVHFGAFTFETPPPGSKQLDLEIQGAAGDKLKLRLANLQTGSDERPGGTFFPYGYLEQANHRISVNGLALVKGDRVALENSQQGITDEELDNERATRAANARVTSVPVETPPTRMPPEVNPSALELAGGKQIQQQATLRVEDVKSGEVQYLYIVILDGGEVKGVLLK